MEWGKDGRDVRDSQKQNNCLACSSPALHTWEMRLPSDFWKDTLVCVKGRGDFVEEPGWQGKKQCLQMVRYEQNKR